MAELKTLNITLNSTGFKQLQSTLINIGGTKYQPSLPAPSFYLFLVIDRASGAIVKEDTINSVTPPAMFPTELLEFDNSSYIWLFVSGNMGVTSLPTGELAEFFIDKLGVEKEFSAFQQIVQQGQNTGLDNFCLALAAIPGEPAKSISSYYIGSNPFQSASLIIQLVPDDEGKLLDLREKARFC